MQLLQLLDLGKLALLLLELDLAVDGVLVLEELLLLHETLPGLLEEHLHLLILPEKRGSDRFGHLLLELLDGIVVQVASAKLNCRFRIDTS